MAISNNIENILGTKLPEYLKKQIQVRIDKNSRQSRDNDNLLYIANKTGWIRVISAVDIRSDISSASGVPNLLSSGEDTLAKNNILFGGTSAYKNNSYKLKEGFEETYNSTGEISEVVNYGYKPMPGLISVRIASQGKLGSIRSATINFKAHNKAQLDVIDKLYFKPGFSVLIEWGNTLFYNNDEVLSRGENYLIDPFQKGIGKEEILAQINQNVALSNGNYDAMLGIITNFNFSFNKDGSFDCTIVAQGLGVLAEGTRINNANNLPGVLAEEVIRLAETVVAQTAAERQNVDTGNVNAIPNPTSEQSINLNANLLSGPVPAGSVAVSTTDIYGKPIPLTVPSSQVPAYLEMQKRLQAEQQINTIVKEQHQKFSSFLECFLRTLQIHSFNKVTDVLVALNKQTPEETKDGPIVYDFNMYADDRSFIKNMFSNGSLSFLFNGNTATGLFQENASYGFNKALLEAGLGDDREDVIKLLKNKISLEDILHVYIVSCKQSQDLFEGAGLNNPCYIPLSFFLMILNHACLLYENGGVSKKANVPLIPIDFNPDTNLILCNPQTISVDPYKFLIKFQAGPKQFLEIFREEDITKSGDGNSATFKDEAKTPAWNPNTDKVSPKLPNFRASLEDRAAYRGKIMNTLVSIDYLLNLVKSHSDGDDNNTVNLKDMLESILFQMSKSLGGFNALRLAYSDKGNCYYISDDQSIPAKNTNSILTSDAKDYTEIPVYGLESIVEDMRLQTDMSTKLSSWLAISANSNAAYQATAGVDTTSLGIYNSIFVDRYKPNVTANYDYSDPGKKKDTNKTTINGSVQFNELIQGFYSKGENAQDRVDGGMNYYIDRMSKLKSQDLGTKASLMIPVSINFTTDGISGFGMGQAFVIDDKILPATYTNLDATKKVGFIITGTEQIIESNRWKTNIKASMYYLKKMSDYSAILGKNTAQANNSPNITSNSGATNFVATNQQAKANIEKYLGRTITQEEYNALIAATFAEASNKSPQEQALVMAVILNRAKTSNSTITSALTAKNQFQSVTGTSNSPGASANYINGPTQNVANNIYSATNTLNTTNSKYNFFASANQSAYGPGTDTATISKIKSLQAKCPSCVTQVGGSYFTTQYWGG